jgi:CubicO group peptidase (beta-lactamase class C family)
VPAGRIGLDARASDYLTAVRLGDDAITVAELLSHTSGVDDPAGLYGDRVPELAALTGPVVPCHGRRGEFRPSNGGYAVLGQLIADVAGTSFAQAVTRLVLDPLGMRDSRYPARTSDIGEGAVSGYSVTADGTFVPVPARICTVQAGRRPR